MPTPNPSSSPRPRLSFSRGLTGSGFSVGPEIPGTGRRCGWPGSPAHGWSRRADWRSRCHEQGPVRRDVGHGDIHQYGLGVDRRGDHALDLDRLDGQAGVPPRSGGHVLAAHHADVGVDPPLSKLVGLQRRGVGSGRGHHEEGHPRLILGLDAQGQGPPRATPSRVHNSTLRHSRRRAAKWARRSSAPRDRVAGLVGSGWLDPRRAELTGCPRRTWSAPRRVG